MTPLRYGIAGDLWGLWFVRGTMLRDLTCLNKAEPLPWDCWGIVTNDRNGPAAEEMDWLDHVAEVTIAADGAFDEVRGIYEATPGLHMPAEWSASAMHSRIGHGAHVTDMYPRIIANRMNGSWIARDVGVKDTQRRGNCTAPMCSCPTVSHAVHCPGVSTTDATMVVHDDANAVRSTMVCGECDAGADAVRPYRALVPHRPQIHLPGNGWRVTPGVCAAQVIYSIASRTTG